MGKKGYIYYILLSRYQWHMIQCKNISRQADYSVMNPCENAFERSMRVLSLVNSMVNTNILYIPKMYEKSWEERVKCKELSKLSVSRVSRV